MKAYGYQKTDERGRLLSLTEITIQSSTHDLETIIEFLGHVKELMDKYGADYGHEHLRDFCDDHDKHWDGTDLIITRNR